MEVYILDSLHRRIRVIDKFESLVWTERFNAWGDFELDLLSNQENRTLFITDVRLSIKESKRVMVVETTEDFTDDEGKRILKVKGRSLEKILEDRMLALALGGMDEIPATFFTGEPPEIVFDMYTHICVDGTLDVGDIISDVSTLGSGLYPEDTIVEPTDIITYEIGLATLYRAIVELCAAYEMGFRFVRNPSTNALYFEVYMGSDRTTNQTTVAAIVFSPDMDNTRNTRLLTSTALYKNVAYVFGTTFAKLVYDTGVDPSTAGFERRVLMVEASDIDDATFVAAEPRLIQRGKEALAQQRRFTYMDGELAQTTQYVYERDYYLGDLVEFRDDDGATSFMQVTEQTFVNDKEGFSSRPTLTIKQFITPGSWLDAGPTLVWDDFTTEVWDDMAP